MISKKEMSEILEKPESSILDFKENLYDFKNDKDLKNTSKFIKDVISFSNTIRNEKGRIIFGVKEKEDKTLELIGLNQSIDDSILQEKVKDKVFPRPQFLYYELDYNNNKIGILEFPIVKYELPITPAVKMKGLEIGKVYYRNGSSNTEANAIDVIRINDWLQSLKGDVKLTLEEKVSEILRRLTLNKEKLSTVITDLLNISKVHNLLDVRLFCAEQMIGVKGVSFSNDHLYRAQKVFITPYIFELNPYMSITANKLREELEEHKGVKEFKMIFNQPIIKLVIFLQNLVEKVKPLV